MAARKKVDWDEFFRLLKASSDKPPQHFIDLNFAGVLKAIELGDAFGAGCLAARTATWGFRANRELREGES